MSSTDRRARSPIFDICAVMAKLLVIDLKRRSHVGRPSPLLWGVQIPVNEILVRPASVTQPS